MRGTIGTNTATVIVPKANTARAIGGRQKALKELVPFHNPAQLRDPRTMALRCAAARTCNDVSRDAAEQVTHTLVKSGKPLRTELLSRHAARLRNKENRHLGLDLEWVLGGKQ